jgi:hypothetical protein
MYIRQIDLHRVRALLARAKVFRHTVTVQNGTFSPISIYVLNVFNVGHPAEA